nr:unnamed protein product [Digitaria exilis]
MTPRPSSRRPHTCRPRILAIAKGSTPSAPVVPSSVCQEVVQACLPSTPYMISGSTASCRIGASRPRFYASAGRPPLVIGRAAGSATDQPPTFRPTPWSPLGPTDTSFIDDDGGVFNYAEPLAASRGLVLVKLVPSTLNLQWTRHDTSTPSPSSLPSSTPSPANATSPRLPALASHAVHTYAIVTTADLDPPPRASMTTKLPCVRAGGCSPLLCVTRDGKLSVASVYPMHMTIWTQQQQQQDGGDPAPCGGVAPHPGDPAESQAAGVFILDLEDKVLEKVMDRYPSLHTNNGRIKYLPYEMDLPDFFVSRLGGLLRSDPTHHLLVPLVHDIAPSTTTTTTTYRLQLLYDDESAVHAVSSSPTHHQAGIMEVHAAAPAVGKRMWSYLRAIFFMARKGLLSNKRKLLLGVHLLMKRRPNKAVSRTVAALLSHHHGGHGSNALRRRGEYEFSCTNSPAASSGSSSKRHLAYFPCLGAVAEEDDDHRRYSGSHLESPVPLARIEYYAAASPAPSSSPEEEEEEYSCCASPALMMAGAASVRVSNYSSSEEDEGGAGGGAAVDDEAEEFIRRFYEQLRRQNTVAMLPYMQDCAA